MMYFDNSKRLEGAGDGVVLISLQGDKMHSTDEFLKRIQQ
jgi:hypothetical protein